MPDAELVSPSRTEQRNVMHPDLLKVLAQAQRERDAAMRRFESANAILQSHTLWQHSDGQDLCDFDGETWPCNTLGSLGFIYGIEVQGW